MRSANAIFYLIINTIYLNKNELRDYIIAIKYSFNKYKEYQNKTTIKKIIICNIIIYPFFILSIQPQ
jgi:hypothetical protein